MVISFRPIKNGERWAGFDWSINNEDELAEFVASVALGQYRHVEHVLAETDFTEVLPAPTALEGARQLLSVPKCGEPYHRDGWLFQVIGWIAAHIQNEASLIAPPHMQHADKGFDGLHVQIDHESQMVRNVVICEEKATNKPRKTIRDQVWQEFSALETGTRDNLLTARVSTLLATRPELDSDQAVQKILWSQARAYRVAITVNDSLNDAKGRKLLFKGYSTIVSGSVTRRCAETLYIGDLRSWMERIAKKALKAAERMADADV